MKLSSAEFVFVDGNECVEVSFYDDHVCVSVAGKEVYRADNAKKKYGGRPYKPCISHCLIVYRHATQKKQNPDHARAAKGLRPKLTLISQD